SRHVFGDGCLVSEVARCVKGEKLTGGLGFLHRSSPISLEIRLARLMSRLCVDLSPPQRRIITPLRRRVKYRRYPGPTSTRISDTSPPPGAQSPRLPASAR